MTDETRESAVLRFAPYAAKEHAVQSDDFSADGRSLVVDQPLVVETAMVAELRADVCEQWSWASSSARIPQISSVLIELSEPVAHARVNVAVHDGDVVFGTKTAHDGPLAAGPSPIRSIHVPLSAIVMSRVDERQSAECTLTIEDMSNGRVLARVDEAIDVQPRDLYLWTGDPRRKDQSERLRRRLEDIEELFTDRRMSSRCDRIELARRVAVVGYLLVSRRLPADTVQLVTFAAGVLCATEPPGDRARSRGRPRTLWAPRPATRPSSPSRLDDVAEAEERADATRDRHLRGAPGVGQIAYSEPPPGWDYRARVSASGTTATSRAAASARAWTPPSSTAAVMEQVGLYPVLVLIPGHIFVGYWRRNPLPDGGPSRSGTRRQPVVCDPRDDPVAGRGRLARRHRDDGIHGWARTSPPARPGSLRARRRRSQGSAKGSSHLIDVAAARQCRRVAASGGQRAADGVTEIIEYRPAARRP